MDPVDVFALVITFPFWFSFVLMGACMVLMVFMLIVEVVAIAAAFVVAMVMVVLSPVIYTMQQITHCAHQRFEPMRPVIIVLHCVNTCAEKPEQVLKAIEGKIKK